ncbi:transposable element Tcb1 transposase, partial [Trichonephila clavipes]
LETWPPYSPESEPLRCMKRRKRESGMARKRAENREGSTRVPGFVKPVFTKAQNSYPGFSSGRPRGTTPADDRYIVLQARRNRRQTAGEIARHDTGDWTTDIAFYRGQKTARWWSVCTTPCTVCTLTPAHRRRRSLWCREHRNWRDNEWDEYSLQMRADSV